jgi:hypothetical protein
VSNELEGDRERPLRLGGDLLGGVRRRGDLLDGALLGGDLLGGDRLGGDFLGGDRRGDLLVDLLVQEGDLMLTECRGDLERGRLGLSSLLLCAGERDRRV